MAGRGYQPLVYKYLLPSNKVLCIQLGVKEAPVGKNMWPLSPWDCFVTVYASVAEALEIKLNML